MNKSALIYSQKLPTDVDFDNSILIYDSLFNKNPQIKKWLNHFSFKYAVKSGEGLKDLVEFPRHMQKVLALYELQKSHGSKNLQIISLGGGSVGDFSGFIASVLKRGVPLIHCPSTWLAAIDSSHGGKTALNVRRFKNQIGTFYPAQKIYLIEPILISQPHIRAQEALGEVFKIALIEGGSLWAAVKKTTDLSNENLWRLLPALIKAKYKVVQRDPYETKGLRSILNLGHTLGHVFESKLGLAHGSAVLYGTQFSLLFSRKLGILSKKDFLQIESSPCAQLLPSLDDVGIALGECGNLTSALLADKKTLSQKTMNFVVVRKAGHVLVKPLPVKAIIDFANSLT